MTRASNYLLRQLQSDEFLLGYFDAALTDLFDEGYGFRDLDDRMLETQIQRVQRWRWSKQVQDIVQRVRKNEDFEYDDRFLGFDLFFSRNGQSSFSESDWLPVREGQKLDKLAKKLGTIEFYIGEDELIHAF